MTPKELLLKNITHASLHKDRIVDALEHLENLLPIIPEKFINLASDYPENDQVTNDSINNLYVSCQALIGFVDDYLLKLNTFI